MVIITWNSFWHVSGSVRAHTDLELAAAQVSAGDCYELGVGGKGEGREEERKRTRGREGKDKGEELHLCFCEI